MQNSQPPHHAELPFTYEATPAKKLTPTEQEYISEIQHGNLRHLNFVPWTQEVLTKLLASDANIDPKRLNTLKQRIRVTLYHEGKFLALQQLFQVKSKRIEKLRKRRKKAQEETKKREEARQAKDEEVRKVRKLTNEQGKLEAQMEREKWLNIHEPETENTNAINNSQIFEHIHALQGHRRNRSRGREPCLKYFHDGNCSRNQKEIREISRQLLFLELGTRDDIMNSYKKIEYIFNSQSRNGDSLDSLSPQETYIACLGLPELGNIKILLLDEMLAIIQTIPITSQEHRRRIQVHNEEIRKTLKKSFDKMSQEELQELGLEKLRKFNNKYWAEAGGLHYNDPLPNGEIEYLPDNIGQQQKLLQQRGDWLYLANLDKEERKQIRHLFLKKFPDGTAHLGKLQLNDKEKIKESWRLITSIYVS